MIVHQALLNFRVPKAASKLMRFYAARSEGFRPSLRMICEETGIMRNHVAESRKILIKYGFIGYDGKIILIDWYRLCAFASLDSKLMGRKKHWRIAPVDFRLLNDDEPHRCNIVRSKKEKRFYDIYNAIGQAIAAGVKFKELDDVAVHSSKCVG